MHQIAHTSKSGSDLQLHFDFGNVVIYYFQNTGLPFRFNTHFDHLPTNHKMGTGLPRVHKMVADYFSISAKPCPFYHLQKPIYFLLLCYSNSKYHRFDAIINAFGVFLPKEYTRG
jgi:hypothetical protein